MGHSQSLFPIKIYRDFYPNTEYLKNNLFPKLQNSFAEAEEDNVLYMKGGTLCSYNVGRRLHIEYPEETKDVVNFVAERAKEYWKECNYYEGLTPYVMQMWANTTPKGGWIHSHLHSSMPFTAVVYIDASPDQGNLFLENPLDMLLMSQPIGPNVPYPMGDEIEINTGDLVMFPGWMKHSVKPNTTDRPRLMLGFNIGSTGTYYAGQWEN